MLYMRTDDAFIFAYIFHIVVTFPRARLFCMIMRSFVSIVCVDPRLQRYCKPVIHVCASVRRIFRSGSNSAKTANFWHKINDKRQPKAPWESVKVWSVGVFACLFVFVHITTEQYLPRTKTKRSHRPESFLWYFADSSIRLPPPTVVLTTDSFVWLGDKPN